MQNEIVQYIVKRVGGQKQVVAVLVGTMYQAVIKIGWSRANINAGDRFDKEFGLQLARERIRAKQMPFAPHSLAKDIYAFSERCRRYFKGYDVQPIRIANKIRIARIAKKQSLKFNLYGLLPKLGLQRK